MRDPVLCSEDCLWCDGLIGQTNQDMRDNVQFVECRLTVGEEVIGSECPHTSSIMAEARRRGGTCDCVERIEAAIDDQQQTIDEWNACYDSAGCAVEQKDVLRGLLRARQAIRGGTA